MSSPLLLLSLLLLLLLSLSLPPSLSSMIDDNVSWSLSSNDVFISLWSFQFSAGGTVSFSLTQSPTPYPTALLNTSLQILFCSDSTIEPLRSVLRNDVCDSPTFNYVKCDWQTKLGNYFTLNASSPSPLIIPTSDWYRIIALNCGGQDYEGTYSVTAINPGGEYLSLHEVPFKTIHVYFIIAWTIATVVWSTHLYRYRHFNVKLQRRVLLFPLCRIIFSLFSNTYWNDASHSGHYSAALSFTLFIIQFLDHIVMMGALMAIAKGWGYMKNTVSELEKKVSLGVLCLFAFSYVIYNFMGGITLFVFLILYASVLRFILNDIATNISLLVRQIQILHRYDVDVDNTPLMEKMNILKRTQVAIVMFISVQVIFLLWATIFLRNSPWITEVISSVLTYLLCVGVAYNISLKPFNPYYLQIVLLQNTRELQQAEMEAARWLESEKSRKRGRRRGGSGQPNEEEIISHQEIDGDSDSSSLVDQSHLEKKTGEESRHPLIENSNGRSPHDDNERDDGGDGDGERRLLSSPSTSSSSTVSSSASVSSSSFFPSVFFSLSSPLLTRKSLWFPSLPVPPLPKHPYSWIPTLPHENNQNGAAAAAGDGDDVDANAYDMTFSSNGTIDEKDSSLAVIENPTPIIVDGECTPSHSVGLPMKYNPLATAATSAASSSSPSSPSRGYRNPLPLEALMYFPVSRAFRQRIQEISNSQIPGRANQNNNNNNNNSVHRVISVPSNSPIASDEIQRNPVQSTVSDDAKVSNSNNDNNYGESRAIMGRPSNMIASSYSSSPSTSAPLPSSSPSVPSLPARSLRNYNKLLSHMQTVSNSDQKS